ncbi:MAG: sodium:solute symporter [Bacteroidota bacterium]
MTLTPQLILLIIAAYFVVLLTVSWLTSRGADSKDFFVAGRQSPWFLVAFGMIGASLSGVTFISIPGVVGAGKANQAFSYMQMVFGYLAGYAFIAAVLLPLYYRLQLTSIYTYLEQRFGTAAYKTGAGYFLLSRTVGASLRLYLVAIVLQQFVLAPLGVPFWATVAITILLIWVYTFQGGIKTIVWTDTLQTLCMLTAVSLTIFAIGDELGKSPSELFALVRESDYGQLFFFDQGWSDPNNFFKQFFSGALITIVMTGLDQDMMQKNLSCRSLQDARKNMFSFSIILVLANVLFLTLGALLYLYAAHIGLDIPARTDQLYPTIALDQLSPVIGIAFILGLIAAAYSSADSALTSLTTSFCVDFLGFEKSIADETSKKKTRLKVHIGFSLLLFLMIIFFNSYNDDAVITKLFQITSYTYGPILGLFAFGMFTNWQIRNRWVLAVCLLAPATAYFINWGLLLLNVNIGFLIWALNGITVFLGLRLIAYKQTEK